MARNFICIINKILWICVLISFVSSDDTNDWVSPDAWSLSSPNKNNLLSICPKCECHEFQQKSTEEKISLIYYKKILKFLFNRNKLEFEQEKNIYYRAMLFTFKPSQIDKLEKSTDPRDWDAILSDILIDVKTFTYPGQPRKIGWIEWMYNILLTWFKLLFSLSELRFELLLVIAVLIIIYIKKMHGVSLAAIVIFGLFTSGYIYKYYECNRKLEIDQLSDLYDLQNMPCSENRKYEKNIWNLWGLFSTEPSKAQCMDYLRKKNKLNLPFCRPDDVFFSYINEIMLNQFQLTVERSTNIFKQINEMIPFPYNIIASIIFCTTLVTFLHLTFKYMLSPSVWWHFIKIDKSGHATSSSPSHYDDKISGDNLKNFLEILKFKTDSIKQKVERVSIIASGVQILGSTTKSKKDLNEEENADKTVAVHQINEENHSDKNSNDNSSSHSKNNDNLNHSKSDDDLSHNKTNDNSSNNLKDVLDNQEGKENDINENEEDDEDDIEIISPEFSFNVNKSGQMKISCNMGKDVNEKS